MYFIKSFTFIFILLISIYSPYKAFIQHIPVYEETIIDIYPGESINEVFSKITTLNIVNKLFLKSLIKSNNLNLIQRGEYDITKKSIKNIIIDMNNGKTVTHKIKINEGITIFDLENLLDQSLLINDCSFLKCLESKYSFNEGILYPDTYYYKKGMKASSILIKSHERLDNYLDNNIKDKSMNKEDILILASIIEKEAGNDEEKLEISGVFLKRLLIDMRLQADPTIIYGLLPNFDGDIKKSDILNRNNKYNTYMINGLPPTPISISSLSSIDAAINGSPGEYLFFVADSPTSHYFSKTYEEHVNKIKELGLN
jgi:UPF0755 protein